MTQDVLNVIERTKLIPDPSLEDRTKGIRGTRVEVVLKNGKEIEETVLVPKGDPENPLTREDVIDKLHVCAKGKAGEKTLNKLVETILNISGKSAFSNPMQICSKSI